MGQGWDSHHDSVAVKIVLDIAEVAAVGDGGAHCGFTVSKFTVAAERDLQIGEE